MRKKVGAALIVAAMGCMMCMCLTGCGDYLAGLFVGQATSGSGAEVADNASSGAAVYVSGQAVDIEDYDATKLVTLTLYKGVQVDCRANDDEIQGDIDALLNDHVIKIKKGTAEKGMSVNIDYTGKLDGKEFKGGSAKGTTIKLGESNMIAGFDDGIIGMKVGEKKDVDLTFPDEYPNNPDLAGKKTVFTMKLNYIEKLPELNDELVSKNTSYKTVEEYKNSLKKAVTDSKKAAKVSTALEKIVRESDVKSVPPTLQLAEKEALRMQMENQMKAYGMTIEQAVTTQGMTMEQFEKYLEDQARSQAESELILEAIALTEKVDLSDVAIDAHIQEMIKNANSAETTDGEKKEEVNEETLKQNYKDYYGDAMPFRRFMRSSLIYEKVSEIVGNAVKIVE